MNIRKTKKAIKKINDVRFQRIALSSLKMIRQWSRIIHVNSKSNMKILTRNFYRNGEFII